MSYYYDHETDATERRIDYDLSAAIGYNPVPGFALEDVAYVLGAVLGENDGPDYWWLVAMRDHTYAVVNGGCDYTGWDCQSSANAEIFPTLRQALESIPETESHDNRKLRKSIEMQLVGELAFGEVKQ